MVKNYPHEQGEMDVGKCSLRRASALFGGKTTLLVGVLWRERFELGNLGASIFVDVCLRSKLMGYFLGGLTLK